MKKIKKLDLKNKKIVNTKLVENLVFLVYIILVFVTIKFHENWRDEAQQWFLAKDLSVRRIN